MPRRFIVEWKHETVLEKRTGTSIDEWIVSQEIIQVPRLRNAELEVERAIQEVTKVLKSLPPESPITHAFIFDMEYNFCYAQLSLNDFCESGKSAKEVNPAIAPEIFLIGLSQILAIRKCLNSTKISIRTF